MMLDKDHYQQLNKDVIKKYLQIEPGCYFRHYCCVCSKEQHDNYCFLKNKRDEKVLHDIHCQTCISLGDCKNAINGELSPAMIPRFHDHLSKLTNVKNPLENFSQGYYPIVEMDSPKIIQNLIQQIQEQGIDTIAVNPSKNMTTTRWNLLRPGTNKPLRDILNFDGTIILNTNFDDKFCKIILENTNRFNDMINILEPDVITTLDANFYTDQPNFITALQLDKVFRSNNEIIDLEQKMIGLVPPAMPPYFEIGLLTQLSVGHKTIAIPMQEINARNAKENKKFKNRIIQTLIHYQHEINFKFMLLSTSPKEGVLADAWSSFTWAMIPQEGYGEAAELNKKQAQFEQLKKYLYVANKNLVTKHNQRSLTNYT